MRSVAAAIIVLISLVMGARYSVSGPTDGSFADWPYYGGDPGGTRYSLLTQINRTNVAQLKVAWEYHTGDLSDGSGGRRVSCRTVSPIRTRLLASSNTMQTRPFPADSFARAVSFAINQPADVDINEIVFRPTKQEL